MLESLTSLTWQLRGCACRGAVRRAGEKFRGAPATPEFMASPGENLAGAPRDKRRVSLIVELKGNTVRIARLQLRGEVALHEILNAVLCRGGRDG